MYNKTPMNIKGETSHKTFIFKLKYYRNEKCYYCVNDFINDTYITLNCNKCIK